jgi:protein TonB
MKVLLFALTLSGPVAAFAQRPAPAPKLIVLDPAHMQTPPHSDPNRPDRAPVYPGGEQALGMFFLEHLNYPEAARAKGLNGKVLVTATVNADGTISHPVVALSLSPECDAEALRVVPLLAGWQPAMRRGRPLAVLIQLPVPFGTADMMTVTQSDHLPRRGKK